MNGQDLYLWRFKHKVTKIQLAEKLGKTRQTIANWEKSRTRLPLAIEEKLSVIVADLNRPVETPPEWISRDDHPHLYEPKLRGVIHAKWNEAHPYSLVRGGWLAWEGVTYANHSSAGPHWPAKWPASILETDAYKDALRRRKAGEPGWPPLTDEERARKINLLKSLQEQQNEEIKNRKNNR